MPEKVTEGLLHDRAADFGNGLGQRNILGANFHAVLRVAAFLDAAIAHQRRQTLALQAWPVGWVLNRRTCAMVAAPTKPVSSLNCGQASMQQQQEMQRESG